MKSLLWIAVAVLGALSFGVLALQRGESVSALWLVAAAVCTHLIAYRFYSYWIANSVLKLDPNQKTPAVRMPDGKDFVATPKTVLFGHHFAAIAGAGPLVGPILAAQMGYLPGILWLLVGVVFAGAVQDMVILAASVRRDGKSLGEMIRMELGVTAGFIAKIGIFLIMILLIAVLSLVVVKALAHSPWGLFTLLCTVPIALAMGIAMRFVRVGRVLETSLWGFGLLILSLWGGQWISMDPYYAALFTRSAEEIAFGLIAYGMIASALPVWLLLAPRDYLSTFLKIGVIVGLAVGVLWVAPDLKMPAITRFIDGSGPVFAGSIFPFLFVTIACGAISGFHALISSGTTPKMVANEPDVRAIGYGAMLAESFVAVMALVAACALEPGVYFAMNTPMALLGKDEASAALAISQMGFTISPEMLKEWAVWIGETSILARTGGAPTLAVGMADIFAQILGGKALMAFWYHFAILFEALFILTTIDAGTRVGRFMAQEILGWVWKPWAATSNWTGNILGTLAISAGWGYFLVQGVRDPLGGINSLWPLFGIANQMLACIALILVATILVQGRKPVFAWIAWAPLLWVCTTNLTAAWQKLFSENPKIGFLAQIRVYEKALAEGKFLGLAKTTQQMEQVIQSNYVNFALCSVLIGLLVVILGLALPKWWSALRSEALVK